VSLYIEIHFHARSGSQPFETTIDCRAKIGTLTIMVTVSVQDIRFDFARIKSALERGEELMLTYRNRPLAKILPVVERQSNEPDPAINFGTQPESLEPLSNAEIDRAIYA
jgi:antitoxin (DNA-binding transcriptional repressor) of toxin-antitoxin stability system